MPVTKRTTTTTVRRRPYKKRKYVRRRRSRYRYGYSARIRGRGAYTVPGWTLGADAGRAVGNFVGWPVGQSKYFGRIGAAAGNLVQEVSSPWTDWLTGSGDYHHNNTNGCISCNSIINPEVNPPPLSSGMKRHAGIVVRRREYVTDIQAATSFTVSSFTLNPGNITTFPWMSQIAQNFEQYRINGMVWEYKSLSGDALTNTNTALGYVAMATQYDVLDPVFTTKQQMENYDMAQSAKPSRNQLHGIECARNQSTLTELYVRTGAPAANSDLRVYDFGKFNIGVGGFQQAGFVAGELWVTYEIELFKPKIPNTITGIQDDGRYTATACSGGTLAGTQNVLKGGELGLVVGPGSVFTWNQEPGAVYMLTWVYSGTSATITAPSITLSSGAFSLLTAYNYYINQTASSVLCPGNGVASTSYTINLTVQSSVNNPPGNAVSVTLGGGAVIPTNSTLDFTVSQLDTQILN